MVNREAMADKMLDKVTDRRNNKRGRIPDNPATGADFLK
jgi:hypothetical protein